LVLGAPSVSRYYQGGSCFRDRIPETRAQQPPPKERVIVFRPDNWGWRARFGVLIVANEPVPEAEWWAMAPPGVSVHAARVTARAPWASGPVNQGPAGLTLAEDLARGVEQLGRMELSAIVVGHSSSSLAGGRGWDEAVVGRLGELSGGVPVTTNGLDCLAALEALGVRRPFVVMPPWYGDDLLEAGERYLADSGRPPAAIYRFDLGRGWSALPPGEVHGRGGIWAQDPTQVYRQATANCPSEADGVLIAGTGFRVSAIVEALEHDLARPVIAANQASLWRCLQIAGVSASVEGYGRLLA
jgi:maleate isomerase